MSGLFPRLGFGSCFCLLDGRSKGDTSWPFVVCIPHYNRCWSWAKVSGDTLWVLLKYLCSNWACNQSSFCLKPPTDESDGQYNTKWPISLLYVLKPLIRCIKVSLLPSPDHSRGSELEKPWERGWLLAILHIRALCRWLWLEWILQNMVRHLNLCI